MPNPDALDSTDIRVDWGLRVESVPRRSVVPISKPPLSHEIILFATSNHPLVAEQFPRVQQWEFAEGKAVYSLRGNWRGWVTMVMEHGVEAVQTRCISNGNKKMKMEELRFLGWGLYKEWNIGQYVQHYTGAEGFILTCENDEIFFWKEGDQMKTRGVDWILKRQRENTLMEAEKLINVSRGDILSAVSLIDDPNALDPQLMTPEQIDRGLWLIKTGANPWKFWDVLVWKGQHRGFYQVIDVIPSKKTKSQLMVQIRTNIVNVVGLFVNVDYDYVVDAQLLLPLHIIEPPPPALQPLVEYLYPGITGLCKQCSNLHLHDAAVLPPSIPMWEGTPPIDHILSGPTTSQSDPWNPATTVALEDPTSTPSTLPLEPWRLAHASHHKFYELDPINADVVLFQVKLHGTRILAMDWQQIKGKLPNKMIVYPQRPTTKTNLPLIVTQGEFKDSIVTKVASMGTDLHILPVVASTGDVNIAAPTVKVSCSDCCIIRLQKSAHERWKRFKVAAWRDSRTTKPTVLQP
ncbi:hypothetical protein AAF712_016117 [Marasmius tenuissimus]|uniref:Uncharacterized protein n=1 Tax=Marasmius tenuissimus TaxID=585030 RepID=A0ABR2Z7L2_9AGAR